MSANHILITGATGVVGSAILKKYICNSNDTIYVVVRGLNPEERIKKVLDFWDIYSEKNFSRITIINSNTEALNFGLSLNEFKSLGESLSLIVHAAANVNLSQEKDLATQSELDSIENILKLMSYNLNCKLEHVSTVGVKGISNISLSEKHVNEQTHFFNSYEYAKFQVEKRLQKSIKEGFKVTIHRPSMVVGETSNGKTINFQVFHFILRLMTGKITFGYFPPILNWKLDTIPCDFVAQVIFLSSQQESTIGQVYHLCSNIDESLSLKEISNLIRKSTPLNNKQIGSFKTVSYFIFIFIFHIIKTLPLPSKTKRRIELFPMFLKYTKQQQIFENHLTIKHFSMLDWPKPKTYLLKSIQYYFR